MPLKISLIISCERKSEPGRAQNKGMPNIKRRIYLIFKNVTLGGTWAAQ